MEVDGGDVWDADPGAVYEKEMKLWNRHKGEQNAYAIDVSHDLAGSCRD